MVPVLRAESLPVNLQDLLIVVTERRIVAALSRQKSLKRVGASSVYLTEC
jgi:hypothetical protein